MKKDKAQNTKTEPEKMFIGKYERTIDENSRIIVPINFEIEIGKIYVLEKSLLKKDNNELQFLTLYPLTVFENKTRDVEEYLDAYTGSMVKYVKPNKQRRIPIPQDYKEHANIEKEAVLAGAYDRIQIWNPDNFKKYEQICKTKSLKSNI